MCAERVRLTSSIRDGEGRRLPEPVGPVTSTSPRGRAASSCRVSGRPSSSSDLIFCGIRRNAAPTASLLEEHVDAEAGDAGHRVGHVDLPVDLEPLLLLGGEDAVEELLRRLAGQRVEILDRPDFAVHADRRGGSSRQVQVGGAPGGHAAEQLVDRVRGVHFPQTGYRQRIGGT